MGIVADYWRTADWVNRSMMSFLLLAIIVGTPIVLMLEHKHRRQAEEQFRQDVAEGRRLASGELIVRDEKTGCQYIRVVANINFHGEKGYTLVPRLGEDAQPMGCGKK